MSAHVFVLWMKKIIFLETVTGENKGMSARKILNLYLLSDNRVCVEYFCTVFDKGLGRNRLNDTKTFKNVSKCLLWDLMFPGLEIYFTSKLSWIERIPIALLVGG